MLLFIRGEIKITEISRTRTVKKDNDFQMSHAFYFLVYVIAHMSNFLQVCKKIKLRPMLQ